MTEDLPDAEAPITVNDLKFFATLCLLSLKDLGHIHTSQYGHWEITFADKCEERGVLGGTVQIDGVQVVLISPTARKDNVLSTVTHEIVHLIQFMKGDAKSGEREGELVWKGELYKILPGNHENHAEYDGQPWEEEAFRLAPQIVADLRKVPISEIAKVWLSMDASQWSLDLFAKTRP